jgi:hypothetical protein
LTQGRRTAIDLSRDATNPLYHFHLGIAHAQRGDDGKARQALQRALSIDSRFEGAAEARHTLAGLVY